MTPELFKMILSGVILALQYGVPAVTDAISALNKKEITLEDIENLRITKSPEEY